MGDLLPMGAWTRRVRGGRRLMAYSAAAMYGGAAFVALIEGAIPGGQPFSLAPGFAALGIVVVLVRVGPRLPVPALAALGPIGTALIGFALATTETTGDGAVLYIWPVLWTSFFFGRAGAITIVAWTGLVHAVTLISLPPEAGNIDRWLDVMVTTVVVAAVVDALARRNDQLFDRINAEARIDQLTGLPNRRGFEERVEIELARARRNDAPVAAISFDIDHFKLVNDEWGHDAGDRVLARLGDVFRTHTRGTDVVARMGGEEFVAVLPDTDGERARRYAERVRGAFADGGGSPRPTLSAGVAVAVAPADVKPLVQAADSALYRAKRDGRDRTVVDQRPAPLPA